MDVELDVRRKNWPASGLGDIFGIQASAVMIVECINNSYSTRYSKNSPSIGYYGVLVIRKRRVE